MALLLVLAGVASSASPEAQALPSVVAAIDDAIRRGWQEGGLAASAEAEDGEFCRRAFLDLVGRIPTRAELRLYEADRRSDKKRRLIDSLLYGDEYRSEYAHYWASLWTTMLIGRLGSEDRNSLVDRAGLYQYLEESFRQNKPYDRLVHELVSATGGSRPDAPGFNGAVNFLVGKLDDQATQATAQTARLFLGLQVQCTQCHNHPFNDWKQSQFWGLNSFFRQAVALRRFEPGSRDIRFVELANQDFAGEDRPPDPETARVYYELRNGRLQAAFPVFVDGTAIDASGYLEDVNRRDELARLIIRSEQLPRAIVNRLWAHFLGHGFTNPVDDMGPHNPPVYPELLARLSAELSQNSFDLKQLMQWIMSSEPYGLSSRARQGNEADDPSLGKPPRFSRFYLRQMTAEQLYESLVLVDRGETLSDPEQRKQHRERWLRQFTLVLGTDEGDDATTFNGTITQTLMMFNGELMQQATHSQKGGFLAGLVAERRRPADIVAEMYLTAFARRPTRQELQGIQRVLAGASHVEQALEDLWWALLNSNEFILIR